MPIVISEFEVVPEPPPQTQAAAPAPPPRPPSPYELMLAVAHHLRREARVKAD